MESGEEVGVAREEEIRSFITENFMIGQNPAELKNDTSFLDNGIIDSLGVLELVSFIEDRFGVEVKDEELVPENLDSIKNLLSYIAGKQAE
jgi:acyl carrier protein